MFHLRAELMAVLIVDLCGFTKLMQKSEDAAIAMVHRLREVGKVHIEAGGGQVINAFADNLFAVLPTVEAAVKAARSINASIPVSSGIGWGLVWVEGLDPWGLETIEASELGENKASSGEILLSEAARLQLRSTA